MSATTNKMMKYFRRAVNKLRRYFFKRIVAHGNAGHLAAVAVKHCAKHQSRKRSAAAAGFCPVFPF
mgnify:CR=1 FL=1